jgi:hypothetical protein
MKKRFSVALTALLMAGLSGRADYCRTSTYCPLPWKVSGECNCHLKFERGKTVPLQAGPWYLYWPMEAQFVVPAPVGPYPYWPSRQVLPKTTLGPPPPAPPVAAVPAVPGYAAPAAPAAVAVPPANTAQPPAPANPQGVRPSGYAPVFQRTSFTADGADVPSYWFDR